MAFNVDDALCACREEVLEGEVHVLHEGPCLVLRLRRELEALFVGRHL